MPAADSTHLSWLEEDADGSGSAAPAFLFLGMNAETLLLVVAQVLFMFLPITGMYTMRGGKLTPML